MAYTEIRPLRGTQQEWKNNDIVPGEGELALLDYGNGKFGMKQGDGNKKFSQLPFVYDSKEIEGQVSTATEQAGIAADKASIATEKATAAQKAAADVEEQLASASGATTALDTAIAEAIAARDKLNAAIAAADYLPANGTAIELTGAVTGSGTFRGSERLEVSTAMRSAVCGRISNKWYKLMNIYVGNNTYSTVTLLFQSTIFSATIQSTGHPFGILALDLTGPDPTKSHAMWHYHYKDLVLDNVVLLGKMVEGSDTAFELWIKSQGKGVKATVLGASYTISANREPVIETFNDFTGADTLPTGYSQIPSQNFSLGVGEVFTTATTPTAENSLVPKGYVLPKPVVHEIDLSDLTVYDDTKWYPCVLSDSSVAALADRDYPSMVYISVKTYSNADQTVSWSTHQKGPRCILEASFLNSKWGMFTSGECYLIHKNLNTAVNPSDMHAIVIGNQMTSTSYGCPILWLRAGVKYIYSCTNNQGIEGIFIVRKDGYTSGSTTVSPTSTEPTMAQSRTYPFTKLEVLDNPSKETEVVNLGYKRKNPWTYSLSNFLQESKYIIFTSEKNTTNAAHGATYLISGPGDYSGTDYGTYLVTLRVRSNAPAMTVIELSRATASSKPEFGYYQSENTFYFGVKTPTYSSGPKLTVLHYLSPYNDDNHSLNVGIVQTLTTAPTGWKPVEPKKVLVSSYGLVQEPIKIDKRSDTRSYSLQLMAGDAALAIESLKENPYTVLQLWGGDVQTDKDVVIRRVHTPINANDAAPKSYVDTQLSALRTQLASALNISTLALEIPANAPVLETTAEISSDKVEEITV